MGATAAISIGLFAAGTALDAFGQVKAGNAQQRIAELNAQAIEETADINADLILQNAAQNAEILAFNARMKEAQGRDAIRRGVETEGLYRTGVRQLIGEQRASYGAQGVEVNDVEGSAGQVQLDTAYQGEIDALTIRVNASREAWGYQVEAENERMQRRALLKTSQQEATAVRKTGRIQALNARLGGNYAQSAGRYGAAGTILTGGYQLSRDFARRRS